MEAVPERKVVHNLELNCLGGGSVMLDVVNQVVLQGLRYKTEFFMVVMSL